MPENATIEGDFKELANSKSSDAQAEWLKMIVKDDPSKIARFLQACDEESRFYWVNFEFPLTGSTILHHAAQTINLNLVTKVMNWKCGADFSKKNEMGETPLHLLAASKGASPTRKQMLATLILTCPENSVNPLTRDNWGRRAVDLLPPGEEDLAKYFLGIPDTEAIFAAAELETDDSALSSENNKNKSGYMSLKKTLNIYNTVHLGRSQKLSDMLISKASQTKKQQQALLQDVLQPQPLYYTECEIRPMSRSTRYTFPGPTNPDNDSSLEDSDFEQVSLPKDYHLDATANDNPVDSRSKKGSTWNKMKKKLSKTTSLA